MGLVFDRVVFPGVYLPSDGFHVADLDRRIAEIEAAGPLDVDAQISVGFLRFIRYVGELKGFCEFTGTKKSVFGDARKIPREVLRDFYLSVHDRPSPTWEPMFSDGYHCPLPGGREFFGYPGDYVYQVNAVMEASSRGLPLINDVHGLPILGLNQASPAEEAKLFAALIALQATSVLLPTVPLLTPSELVEFRADYQKTLRAFRRSMLRYAGDLADKVAGLDAKELSGKTRFLVESEIVPAIDELREAMEAPQWRKQVLRAVKVVPTIAAGFFTMSPKAAIAATLAAYAAQAVDEIAARGEREEALKRSGLYYLVQYQQHPRSS